MVSEPGTGIPGRMEAITSCDWIWKLCYYDSADGSLGLGQFLTYHLFLFLLSRGLLLFGFVGGIYDKAK